MSLGPAPPPKSLLGRHRVLSPTAGVKVSPICLGGMSFGTAWKEMLGEVDKKTTFEILDFFYDQGGNFVDTSSNYQDEQSELWIGEWMAGRGVRDEMVIATKFTTGYNYNSSLAPTGIRSNFGGNHSKSLKLAVDASLKKLQTNYIDLLWVHWWDFTTSIPELMQSLNRLVLAGTVLYIGISDTPAWIVSKANEYARNHGMAQFCAYQGMWSASSRDFERDIIPMTQAEGMALTPWGALGRGFFKTDAQRAEGGGRNMGGATEKDIAVSKVLESIAKRKDTAITSIALAYVMQKAPYVFPICGGRKIEHLKGNIEALAVDLDDKDIEEIENATPFDIGFPLKFLGGSNNKSGAKRPGDVWLSNPIGHFDHVEALKPIHPQK
ncbi:MAG: hypothetical protein M1838_003046 [Thelocarpon superellum]|nr:MAG: hypothetical protein M1838_003046 [Thelocarpon superellum]